MIESPDMNAMRAALRSFRAANRPPSRSDRLALLGDIRARIDRINAAA